jgi:hypothetical protein
VFSPVDFENPERSTARFASMDARSPKACASRSCQRLKPDPIHQGAPGPASTGGFAKDREGTSSRRDRDQDVVGRILNAAGKCHLRFQRRRRLSLSFLPGGVDA